MLVEAVDPVGMRVRRPGTRRVLLQMRVARLKVGMLVLQDFGIARRPKASGKPHTQKRQPGVHEQHNGQARDRAEPACERISQKPAGVAERELCGEQRRAVFLVGRAAQKPGPWA